MKVIHLISGGDTGGAKTHVHTLLHGLNQHIQADMVCFTDGPFAQEAREKGIRVDVINSRNPLAALKPLREKIAREGYDLIHCHGARGNLIGALLKRSTGLPVVTTVHSDPKLDYMGRPLAALTYGRINTWALRRIPYYIGVSDAMCDLLISRGLDPQQMFAIYNGIDFTPRRPKLTRREFLDGLGLDWPEDAVIAGIAARLDPVKDMGTLLRGFAIAHERQPRLRLIIAGEGQDEAMLKELASELGVGHEVCFAGWLTDTDSFYNALDINTLTSLSETFSYAITEGARFALPTVSSRVGGIPYLIDHGFNGFLFEPKDCETLGRHLAALAGDAGLRRRLGDRLLEKARTKFSIESTIRRQLEIYEAILRRHKRAGRKRDGVILCGAYGQDNAGDEAVLKAMLAELRAVDPDLPLWVMTRKPKQTRKDCRVGAVFTFNVPAFCRRMRKCRLYTNGGGSLMQDVTSSRSLWFYLFTLFAARRMGCRVMMYGCGIGPIHARRNRKWAGRIIDKNVDVITLRDQESRQELESLGVTRPRIVLAADPAVTLPPAPPEEAEAILEQAGLRPREGQRYLGVTVRPWPGFADKLSAFAQAIDYTFEKHGLLPVFIPIESHLDITAAGQVAALLQKAPAVILPPCPSSELAVALSARMDVALSMRLHALIFAAARGVPLVGVAYDPKVSAFLDCVDQDLYVQLDQLTAQGLCALLDAAVDRTRDRAALEAKTARLVELERVNRELAAQLLGHEGSDL